VGRESVRLRCRESASRRKAGAFRLHAGDVLRVIDPDAIPTTFNIFMNVEIDSASSLAR
jgi:uncharacterized protein YcgI (DUF1989 family)